MHDVSTKQRFSEIAKRGRPRSARKEAAIPNDAAHVVPEQLKIVVADDSRIYRNLVEGVLVEAGHAVVFAKNGTEALEAMAKHRPSLLITDWEMPDVTGLDLCRRIRQGHKDYVYIILLTSNTEKDQIIEGLAAGADDYLTKPFHPGELLARVGVGRRVSELHRQIQAKNMALEQLAQVDSLTGLPNRRAIDDWMKRELCGAERHGFPLWLVMADLDHFKSINDTHGHQAGDVVLKRFAELLRANTRTSNLCGRIGGEEFVLALSHVDRAGVKTAIERIRGQFESEAFVFDGITLKATASFGVEEFQGSNALSFDTLLRGADAALYRAKHNGRNRVEFSS